MTITTIDVSTLYKAHKGRVDFVDVPELGYLMIDGVGAPEGGQFGAAVQALFSVSYGAHFLLKRATGGAPKVMPLEALWSIPPEDRDSWQWRALIVQPYPIDEAVVEMAIAQARRKQLTALNEVRYERWEEGRCAQTLHVGPYSAEAPTINSLHDAITSAGYGLRGWHHEIYLGDPRRCAPENLKTILRQPVALS